jgi:hypothetical protein
MALGRFVLLDEDDLSLAALIKSPLLDLDEDDLFALAAKRPEGICLSGGICRNWRRPNRASPALVDRSSAGKRRSAHTSRRMISMPRSWTRMAAARPIFPGSGMKSVMCSTNSSA